jgi:hypothetical protein
MTDAPRQIAVVTAITGYDGLNGAFRARAEELNITRDDVDVLGGLTRGHGSKILAAYPQKAIGRTTLGPILHALKLKLIVVPDDNVIWKDEPRGRRINRPVMLANGTHGIANMQESRALTAQVITKLLRKHALKAASLGGKARAAKLKPSQRRRIARAAAKARWHKPKIVEITNAYEKNAILEQARAAGSADCGSRPNADKPARPKGRQARPSQ